MKSAPEQCGSGNNKTRLFLAVDSVSVYDMQPLRDQTDKHFKRSYSHLPGVQLATLEYDRNLFPYAPPAAKSRAYLAGSAALASNSYRGELVEAEKPELTVTACEGVQALCLVFDKFSKNPNDVRARVLADAYSSFSPYGTVHRRDKTFVARIHSEDVLPLARVRPREESMARRCANEWQELVPQRLQLRPKITPAELAIQGIATYRHKARFETTMAQRIYRTARDMPQASISVCTYASPEEFMDTIGAGHLPGNISFHSPGEAVQPDSDSFRISYFPEQ